MEDCTVYHHRLSAARRILFAVLLLLCPLLSSAAVYEIGPGKPYATLGAAPWTGLGPGDTVNIYWQPTAYHEKLLLACRGTATQPITIQGVPGPQGQLPVIDGQDATTSPQFLWHWAPLQDQGLITISTSDQPGHGWGFKPGYITLANLELRNAAQEYTYTDGTGALRTYSVDACALWVGGTEHLHVIGCTITASGNGLFVVSSGSEETQSRDILVEYCSIYGNGNVGIAREHNIYTEAIGVVFQFNYLGRPRSGSLGNNLKDRSAGTVVRYNWIEGGQHLLDLVEAQDGYPVESLDPSYRQTFVYGNVLIDGAADAMSLVHYGGDNGTVSTYRKGMLYFYNNTVVIQCDRTGAVSRYRTNLLDVSTNDESADVRNNVLFSQPLTPGSIPSDCALVTEAGNITVDTNWISQTWMPAALTYVPFAGTINIVNRTSNPANDPGFADLVHYDLHLKDTSDCIDNAQVLDQGIVGANTVGFQYNGAGPGLTRPINGTAPDLGAFEAGVSGVQSPDFTIAASPASRSITPGAGATYTINIGALNSFAAASNLTMAGLPAGTTATFTPGSVTGAGQSTLTIVSTNSTPVGSYTLTVTGTSGMIVHSATMTLNVTAPITLTSVSVAPTSVVGGVSSIGTVTLSGASSSDVLVSLGSNSVSAMVPVSVTVAAGHTTATFSVATSAVTANAAATVTAGLGGASRTATVTVTPPPLRVASLTISPNGIWAGNKTTGTVTLAFVAAGGNGVVTLHSDNAAVVVPASVSVPNGLTTVTFTVTTKSVKSRISATVTASNSASTVSAKLSVCPLPGRAKGMP
jgi:hypothetical protein